jgi:hypothetical protein
MAHLDNAKSHSHLKTTRKIFRQEREQQDHDSDEILSEIISNDREFIGDGEGDRVIFEKKYFDILPNDLDSEDVEDDDVSDTAPISLSASSLESEDLVNNRRRVNSRRFRRDLTSSSRQKRNFFYPYQQPVFSNNQNQYRPAPRQFITDFYFPQELPYDNIPWNIMVNRRHSPYHPPPTTQFYYDPVPNYQYVNNPYHPINNNRLKPGPTYLPPQPPTTTARPVRPTPGK